MVCGPNKLGVYYSYESVQGAIQRRIIMKKVICVVIYITVILLMFSGCQNPFNAERRPTGQINTKWVSEDGTISFYVDETANGIGTITVGDEIVNIYVFEDFGNGMYIS